jgi:ribosomal protein S1
MTTTINTIDAEEKSIIQDKPSAPSNCVTPLKTGENTTGKIAEITGSAVFVDLGAKGTGIIFGQEFSNSKKAIKGMKIGDEVFAHVKDIENEDGYVELSLKQAGKELAWKTIEQKKDSKETIPVKITGANKGGLLTEISNIQCFLPVSQLSFKHYPKVKDGDKSEILKELQKFIGQELKIKIFDIDKKEQKLILSERMEELSNIKDIFKNVKVGATIEGEIIGIVDFGAFIKFSCESSKDEKDEKDGKKKKQTQELEGLIHISEMDWQLIDDPNKVVKIGQKTKAKIISINNNRISLSLKPFKKNPWDDVEKKYKKGDIVKGEVVKFNPFGAFVKIISKKEKAKEKADDASVNIQGLAHISEFGTKTKMKESLEIGKTYDFEILQIDKENHRMALKLK